MQETPQPGIVRQSLDRLTKSAWSVFLLCWGVVFVLYLPAAKAGKAGSYYTEFLDPIATKNLHDFVFIYSQSLYYFTQLVTYIFYKVFGAGVWPWHLLLVTLHACNCTLLFLLFRRLLQDVKIKNADIAALGAVFLYCISAYNTEVIVHEPCYHYAQGFLLQLLILVWAQRFLQTAKAKYAVWAGLLYLPATYSIEVYLITPLMVCALALFYKTAAHNTLLKKAMLWLVVPELLLLILNMVAMYYVKGIYMGHKAQYGLPSLLHEALTHVPKYVFHIVALGRYIGSRNAVYAFFDSTKGLILFWVAMLLLVLQLLRSHSPKRKAALLLVFWALISICIVVLRPFPSGEYVEYDRYTYFCMPFIYLLLVLGIGMLRKTAAITLFTLFAIANLYFARKMIHYWHDSSKVISELVKNYPAPDNTTVLLLNVPENMHGILMIGASEDGEFSYMYRYEGTKKTNSTIYDVVSYNMDNVQNGAYVNVINDSTARVTLNQWGTWWWYNHFGASSYENKDYKVNMKDVGHWYEITLKHPAQNYTLLYQVGSQWKTVNWALKNTDQD